MIQLVLLLLGADYLRKRWRALRIIGWIWVIAGIFVFIDALDGVLYFSITFFAWLLIIAAVSTLAVAWTGMGGQRALRYVKLGHVQGRDRGWAPFLRMLVTPELWVAAQIRKRAHTMAWTPGLTLDYARALSMLVDTRPFGWLKMAHFALKKMARSRRQWREERMAARK